MDSPQVNVTSDSVTAESRAALPMTAIFLRMYALRHKRHGLRYVAVSRHYHRLAAMYGGIENFRVGR